MGGDYVSSASNHLGRKYFVYYKKKKRSDNLRKGGFATQDTSDDNFFG